MELGSKVIDNELILYFLRHGQIEARGPLAALQLIFAALEPFCYLEKQTICISTIILIWTRTVHISLQYASKKTNFEKCGPR